MKIKICGITRPEETGYLNEARPDYAGFVFYPPSRRNVTRTQAENLIRQLDPRIRRVAVTVSPDAEAVKALQTLPFDLLQIHGALTREALAAADLPVWAAVNIAKPEELRKKTEALSVLPEALREKIAGIVVDGAEFGSGRTFDWTVPGWQRGELFQSRDFILAGGLAADNVQTAIQLFSPDIVDVSSGVEGESGKDFEKIKAFIGKVREHE